MAHVGMSAKPQLRLTQQPARRQRWCLARIVPNELGMLPMTVGESRGGCTFDYGCGSAV